MSLENLLPAETFPSTEDNSHCNAVSAISEHQ